MVTRRTKLNVETHYLQLSRYLHARGTMFNESSRTGIQDEPGHTCPTLAVNQTTTQTLTEAFPEHQMPHSRSHNPNSPNDAAAAAAAAARHAATTHGVNVDFLACDRSVDAYLKDEVSHRSTLETPAIFAIDLASVARQFFHFRKSLPTVRLHYAVKCLPDPMVASALAHLGASFDCASRAELLQIQAALAASGDPCMRERVVYANPVKAVADLSYAQSIGVTHVTLDCVEEVRKLAAHMPHAEALLRIATDDETSAIPLSDKFGARAHEVASILRTARALDVDMVGVAFHVGCGAQSVMPYDKAFRAARDVFDAARSFGFHMHVLDIGGGFPGWQGGAQVTFDDIAACVRRNVNLLFDKSVRVLAEPGRLIVQQCARLALRIVRTGVRNGRRGYWLGDSIFGCFRDAHIFAERFEPAVLACRERDDTGSELCDLFGVTMEPVDVIGRDMSLPVLSKGDWLLFSNMGSYTHSLRTARPDVPAPSIKYVFSPLMNTFCTE